ncbi:uncharacterized protein LOC116275897 [Papio anubis]|uniref:uncharacterized protein LOC116275897 n=1 Tax=Papio anubis TaxID=9555 RepID=UPI0012AD8460|nr:uncharacterized protein LOC116275897 [Papio anubis]
MLQCLLVEKGTVLRAGTHNMSNRFLLLDTKDSSPNLTPQGMLWTMGCSSMISITLGQHFAIDLHCLPGNMIKTYITKRPEVVGHTWSRSGILCLCVNWEAAGRRTQHAILVNSVGAVSVAPRPLVVLVYESSGTARNGINTSKFGCLYREILPQKCLRLLITLTRSEARVSAQHAQAHRGQPRQPERPPNHHHWKPTEGSADEEG